MSNKGPVTSAENDVDNTKTKRGRTSNVTRATAEGEALLKEMGFDDKETPGRRRTRAAIRGDVYTPPAKKGKKATAPGSGRRGRPPKKTDEAEKNKESVDKEEKKEEEEDKDDKADEKKDDAKEADGDADEEEKSE